MKRILLFSLFLLFLVTAFSTAKYIGSEIKAFAYGEKAYKVKYDRYLTEDGGKVIPNIYEMTDIGKIKVDNTDLGIYYIWKYGMTLSKEYWDSQSEMWSEILVDFTSKRKSAAGVTILLETGKTLLGLGVSMLIGDLISAGAAIPSAIKTAIEAGNLTSVALGLGSAGLDTIASWLSTDREDFVTIRAAAEILEDSRLEEIDQLLIELQKKREGIEFASTEIRLVNYLVYAATLSTQMTTALTNPDSLKSAYEIVSDFTASMADHATIKTVERGIIKDAESLNTFLNASIIHLTFLVDLANQLGNLRNEIENAAIMQDPPRMKIGVMRYAATEYVYYATMGGFFRLFKKYLQKDITEEMDYVIGEMKRYESFIRIVKNYLEQKESEEIKNEPPSKPFNPSPAEGERLDVGTEYNIDWVKLSWEATDTENDTLTYDVYFGEHPDKLELKAQNIVRSEYECGGIVRGKTYYWKVVAKDTTKNTSVSPTWHFNTIKKEVGTQTANGAPMIYVEGGTFQMGSNVGDSNEEPVHEVTLTYDFYIGKYEVTFEEYDEFCEDTGRSKPSDEGWGRWRHPVINVSWYDAIQYCNWLSKKDNLPIAYDLNGNFLDKYGRRTNDVTEVVGYRLPTEAEWEYAARGGKYSMGYIYAGHDNVNEVAWYEGNSGKHTHEVGTKKPNELGIYDMSGNVWEYCQDWYNSGYYKISPKTNPYSNTGSNQVIRGGSWGSNTRRVRIAYRYDYSTSYTRNYLGFRICRTVY